LEYFEKVVGVEEMSEQLVGYVVLELFEWRG